MNPSVFRRLLLAAAPLLLAGPMLAQSLPREGGISVWGTGGFLSPADGTFESTFGVSGGIDYFLTRSLSVGATAGGWRAETVLGPHANEIYFDAVATYNWERDRLHPFLQGGIGAYRVDLPDRSTRTDFGGFAAAGLDFSISRAWAVESAVRYHWTPSVEGLSASFLEGLAGVKMYF